MRFRYCLDPVFLCAAALYVVQRFVLRPLEEPHGGFVHSYGNSLLCVPFCLPPVLWATRRIGVRNHDLPPTRFELAAYLVVWSICFKWAAPRIGGPFAWVVPDPWDVVAYAVGALAAAWFWGALRPRRREAAA